MMHVELLAVRRLITGAQSKHTALAFPTNGFVRPLNTQLQVNGVKTPKNGGKESRGSTGLRKAARGRMKRVLNTRCKQKRKKHGKKRAFEHRQNTGTRQCRSGMPFSAVFRGFFEGGHPSVSKLAAWSTKKLKNSVKTNSGHTLAQNVPQFHETQSASGISG